MNEDALILKEYGEAFRKYAKDGIIDMDDRLKHKFNFQVHRLEDFVQELRGVVPPYRQSQYFIVLVKHGTGEKTVGHFHFPHLRSYADHYSETGQQLQQILVDGLFRLLPIF